MSNLDATLNTLETSNARLLPGKIQLKSPFSTLWRKQKCDLLEKSDRIEQTQMTRIMTTNNHQPSLVCSQELVQ